MIELSRIRCDRTQYAERRGFRGRARGLLCKLRLAIIVGVAVFWPAISAIGDGLMEQRGLSMSATCAESECLEAESAHRNGDVPLSSQTPSSSANGKGSGIVVTEWLMIILTGTIALAALCQAWFIWKQAQILEASDKRAKKRDVPMVRMTPLTSSFTEIALMEPKDKVTQKSYEGFTVTNSGFVDVEITSFKFEVGWLPSTATQEPPTALIDFEPVKQHGETTVSTMSLPHRLRHGESFQVLFDRDQLVRESVKLGGEAPIHLRPYCNDSLGNKHHWKAWIAFHADNRTSFHTGPSPGRVSEEERGVMKPAERRQYEQWSTTIVPPP